MSQAVEHYGFPEHNSMILEATKKIPSWQPPPKCNMSLSRYNKRETANTVLQHEFEVLKDSFGSHVELYTDGSKTISGVSCAMITGTVTRSHRLKVTVSAFTAEVYAIILALNYILQNRIKSSVIYTDSLSSLQTICSIHCTKDPIVHRARRIASTIANRAYRLLLCWVPSHVGIPGNEKADRAAAAALTDDITTFDIPSKYLRLCLKSSINRHWQSFWDQQTSNKLHTTKPKIGPSPSASNRLYGVLSCRLGLGHTYLTHGYILREEDPPGCNHCGEQLSILHILIVCPACQHLRERHFFFIL
ncbi:uncharacterized protein LOC135378922 isoform X1 [Ornithodoros turicata]|uniref:uncharacterized protein LOC135378922 isoform X1 n=1 Tax=Ornithodoros turicata TaxID=34597 RepID=UPI00313970BA